MSTAAPTRPGQGGDYTVNRPRGVCAVSGQAIEPDEHYMAALRETPAGFERVEVKLGHWDQFDRAAVVGFWRATMPRPNEKKQLLVDDTVLCELLERLASVELPEKVCFRYVLALILMRKKLVIHEGTQHVDGREIWRVRLKGQETALEIVDPKPTEEQIAAVRDQLGQILSEGA